MALCSGMALCSRMALLKENLVELIVDQSYFFQIGATLQGSSPVPPAHAAPAVCGANAVTIIYFLGHRPCHEGITANQRSGFKNVGCSFQGGTSRHHID